MWSFHQSVCTLHLRTYQFLLILRQTSEMIHFQGPCVYWSMGMALSVFNELWISLLCNLTWSISQLCSTLYTLSYWKCSDPHQIPLLMPYLRSLENVLFGATPCPDELLVFSWKDLHWTIGCNGSLPVLIHKNQFLFDFLSVAKVAGQIDRKNWNKVKIWFN